MRVTEAGPRLMPAQRIQQETWRSAVVRDTAKSGMGVTGNHHLNHLVEFISVNVGGSHQDVKLSRSNDV